MIRAVELENGSFRFETKQAENDIWAIVQAVNLEGSLKPVAWYKDYSKVQLKEIAGLEVVDYVPQTVEEQKTTLQEEINKKLSEISEARKEANRGTFNHANLTFSAHDDAKAEILFIQGKVLKANKLPDNWRGGWFDITGYKFPITTVDAWDQFYDSLIQAGLANAAKAEQLADSVMSIAQSTKVGYTEEDKIKDIKTIKW